MGFFSSISHAFKSAGKGIAHAAKAVSSVVHHIPIVGQALSAGEGLAKGAIGAITSIGHSAEKTATNVAKGAAGVTGAVATGVPSILKGATGAVTGVEGAVTSVAGAVKKEAPVIIGGLGSAVGGIGAGIGGLGKDLGGLGKSLEYILPVGLGVVALMVLRK